MSRTRADTMQKEIDKKTKKLEGLLDALIVSIFTGAKSIDSKTKTTIKTFSQR